MYLLHGLNLSWFSNVFLVWMISYMYLFSSSSDLLIHIPILYFQVRSHYEFLVAHQIVKQRSFKDSGNSMLQLSVPNFYRNDELSFSLSWLFTNRCRGFFYLICRKLPTPSQNFCYSSSRNFHVSTLSKNWVVNNIKSTQHWTQLIILAEISHTS